MYTVKLTIGHNVKGKHIFECDEVFEHVTQYLHVEAFTAFECAGMWQGMREESTRIEICNLSEDRAKDIKKCVPLLAQVMAQDSIMFEMVPDRVEFIEREVIPAINQG